LIRLVENLLNISRIESGRLQFTFREMQLEDLVLSVVNELLGTARKKGLKLEYFPPKKALPPLKIDEEKIRQVAMNLIDNSIKYTKQGKITVSVARTGNVLKFMVEDNGAGIRPEDLPRLFKKFSRGEGMSLLNTEGTGLGLYVAKEMIDAHHGRIWGESAGEGKGSKFCFTLPVKAD
ncbi:MAG: HAMP domain-containing histidine kinase, partial [Planctomycetes bacterium]|nr:HAMP domain-containing histidine kinase [Planctomycetota bacterium]